MSEPLSHKLHNVLGTKEQQLARARAEPENGEIAAGILHPDAPYNRPRVLTGAQMIDMSDVHRPLTKSMAQEWIAALRSGAFKQGYGCLTRVFQSGEEHCCLGVANKIFQCGRDRNAAVLQERTPKGYQAVLLPLPYQIKLYSINDRPESFEVVANYIESQLLPQLPD